MLPQHMLQSIVLIHSDLHLFHQSNFVVDFAILHILLPVYGNLETILVQARIFFECVPWTGCVCFGGTVTTLVPLFNPRF